MVLAARLGVSQAYVCQLERGRRHLTRQLAETLVKILELPPSELPVGTTVAPLKPHDASRALGALGYAGFAYLRARKALNPAELLLRVLRSPDVDARVLEALPWLVVRYPNLEWPWLLQQAKLHDIQNRLGFVLCVARELAELRGEHDIARTLLVQERALDGSRLQREDAFRESMTAAERRWLRTHRPAGAARWNVLSTMNARELTHAF